MSFKKKVFDLSIMVLLCVASSLASTQAKGKINGRFAYGIASDSRLSIYAIDEATSYVHFLGYVLAPGSGPASLALDPKRRFVYVANNGSNDVAVFGANKKNGALTWLANFHAGTGPSDVAADPTGHFVYVANQLSNDVAAFKVTGGTGKLTPVGRNVPAGQGPNSVTVDPSGQFVFVTNQISNDISIYRITAGKGTLTQVGSNVPAGILPKALTVDLSDEFVYVAN